ncbi:MAG: alpha-amylase family glycosyl hydrolase [Desulfocapsaceae bacterium]|nr:alpha-amylase family glycosyl hydrolase [Desulfocapsaceae bacterium]
MSQPRSLAEIDLAPTPGKTYCSIDREWREEFIYFLMVDRFHDSEWREPVLSPNRCRGVTPPDNAFYGGTIKGITQNLDYIAGLGCTAIWLSPVFGNNDGAYHGYNINNYLDIDPRFGTSQDLIDLVDAAHRHQQDGRPFPLRVILDIVINHSGDNWSYPGGYSYNYCNDQQFPFGYWRDAEKPFPTELRNPDSYHRRGNINNWDTPPENQNGDLCGLKDYANDDDPIGSDVINALIKIHSFWIKEADLDGFRVDAVKHMGDVCCSRFCSGIREFAYSLGKRGFFLFGELAVPDDNIIDRYIGPNTSRQDDQTVFFGIDSVLDFPLAEGKYGDPSHRPLRDVIKGYAGPETLFNRLEAQRQRALNRGELGRYLVTFVDNHDSFWQPDGRIGAGPAPDEQIIGAVGFLLCALGTPCLYYGTEQGFEGKGGDNDIREAMFDTSRPGVNLLNTDCLIYSEISAIARVMRSTEALRFGRMYYRQISGDGEHFGFPYGTDYTLAFSRLLYGSEVLVAYNVSSQARSDYIIVDAAYNGPASKKNFLYGGAGSVEVQSAPDGAQFVQLHLAPYQFVVLQ